VTPDANAAIHVLSPKVAPAPSAAASASPSAVPTSAPATGPGVRDPAPGNEKLKPIPELLKP
jgi:hypothetical protein